MKIATFNINNINKRLNNLTAWLERAQPDVVCLQELKAEQRAFPATTLRDVGYGAVWLGERSWNGVAILTRDCDPVLTRSTLPGNPKDNQAPPQKQDWYAVLERVLFCDASGFSQDRRDSARMRANRGGLCDVRRMEGLIGRHAGFFNYDPETRAYCMITIPAPWRDTPGPTWQLVASMLRNQRRQFIEQPPSRPLQEKLELS